MHKLFIRLIVFIAFTVGMSSVLAQDLTPAQPERVLAISTLPVLEPPLTAENAIERYTGAMQKADQAGVTGNAITKLWSELELAAGQYALDDFSGDLTYRTQTYNHIEFFGIQVLNTTAKETPPDLMNVPFDSPEMITRFQQLFDALLPRLNEQIRYITIGNEVDAYLSAHPDEWKAYKQFYEAALTYVHKTAPWIKVGVTVTFNGTISAYEQIADLSALSDVFIMTYYPLNMDFSVRPPDSPFTDFPQMVKWAGDKPLILQEVGYPAAESLGSSEALQADFVRNVFAAWDANAADIPFLNYFVLGDFSDDMCQQFLTYYGLPNQQMFYDYLCTLGLLKVDGTERQAWQAFVEGGKGLSH